MHQSLDEMDGCVGGKRFGRSETRGGRAWWRRGRHLPIVATLAIGLVAGCGSGDSAVEPGSTEPSSEPSSTTSSTVTSVDTTQPESGGEVLLSPASVAPGEILLEPVAVETESAFTTSVAVELETPLSVALPELPIPTTTAPLPAGSVGLAQVRGNEPGLYGGTRDMQICDPEQLVEFLEANPDKALAWAGVHGIEPTEIRSFVADLTPLLLTRDTRVTNHGFVDGAARPHQSVLQAGHAVLVDEYGVPRAKCSCGNPLAEPQPLASAPIYVGDPWPGFEGSTIVVVVPDEPVEEFEVVDPLTGAIISIPRRAGEERLEPNTLPVSLDGLYDCGPVEVDQTIRDEATGVEEHSTIMGRRFLLLQEDGTLNYLASVEEQDHLASAMALMGPGTELESVGTYRIDGATFVGETYQAYSGRTSQWDGVVVSPDRIDTPFGPCVRNGADAGEPAPVDPPLVEASPVEPPPPAEAPEFSTEEVATQYLDLLLLDCGLEFSQILSQGGDDESWRFLVPTPMGDLDLTVLVGTGGDDVLVQPNNQLAGDIAVECGFYEP